MKKFANLLDDVTIVNFKMIFELALRYKSHVFWGVILFFGMFVYFYLNQPTIYSSAVPVKVIGRQSLASDVLSLQEGENASSVSIGELSSMMSSYSFIKMLSTELINDHDFTKMNFGSIVKGNKVLGQDIMDNCKGNTECAIDALSNYAGGLYSVEQGLTDDRYKLTVNTLDEITSLRVSVALVKTIEKKRIQVKQYQVNKEITSVTTLISESRNSLEKQNGFTLIDEEEKNSLSKLELKEKMRILQSSLSNEIANMSSLEAKLGENRRVLKSNKQRTGFNKIKSKVTQQKIADVRANILTFSNIPEARRSKSDNAILAQLKEELASLESVMPEEESLRSQEIEDAFGDTQRNKENDFKFDYLVSKNKVANLKADYEVARKELEELQKDKVSKEADIGKLKSEIEFLKNLESKLLSLKLMNSTMTSDLEFEESGKNISTLRKSSPLKIFSFSFFLSFFLLMVSLIGRYLFDDRIYSENDIAPYLRDLDFFGEAPSFE